ncbi:hypothetical protein RUR49_20200 [Pseudoxanthobacter sp. M-2]|uniref:hypothetical protein n=1 Tax=Pseudoxanthobacter sp. M-2 TaxID=3078754 RepID=UPI0038FCCEE3
MIEVSLARRLSAVVAALVLGTLLAMAGGAPSASAAADGVATGHYKFPARVDPLVATDRETEIWAHVWRPAKLGRETFPVLVFLHGNHGTCGRFDPELGVRVDDRTDYTRNGTCPDGYVVTPNHLGYDYLARRLAQRGYIVVSINANRGITAGAGIDGDGGLNLMRGRLVMRHLALLADWNRGKGDVPKSLGFDPKGHLDLQQVGLMGHSRGGEGVRAALQQMREDSRLARKVSDVRIRAIFEIGPVDGQTSRVLNADGVASAILLPVCDGDVIDLGGMRVFDRTFLIENDRVDAIKATVGVYGANHNFYNTEWQQSDAAGCAGYPAMFGPLLGSEEQRKTGIETLVPFFQANVGADRKPDLNAVFDAGKAPPKDLRRLATVLRNFLPGPIGDGVQVLQRFTKASGISDSGARNRAVGLDVEHSTVLASFPDFGWAVPHDESVRWATLEWDGGGKHFYEVVVADRRPLRLADFKTLNFRAALRCAADVWCPGLRDNDKPQIAVALVSSDGKVSPAVDVEAARWLDWPTIDKSASEAVSAHEMLSTIRVPVSKFKTSATKDVRAIRFVFSGQESGRVAISDITVDGGKKTKRSRDMATTVASAGTDTAAPAEVRLPILPAPAGENNGLSVERPAAGTAATSPTADGGVTLRLTSQRPFPITNVLPVLWIGDRPFTVSAIEADRLAVTFTIPASDYAAVESGAAVRLQIGRNPSWDFGILRK